MIDFRISRLMQKCAAFFKSPRFAMLMVAMIATGVAIAQTSDINVTAGTGALESVAQGIAKYVPFITKLCYAIAGVVAIVGAISVYVAMNNEEQDVKKKIMMVIGACIFFIAAAQALPLFFGMTNNTEINLSTSYVPLEQVSNTLPLAA